ncbi:hypothetical protein [Stenotrophomonas terrae]|uniref:hypothetical protein n=1 Tax=Stenotrophomonas terrae TaxID=405446 RepID=UPI00128ED921|nr:hypothetical protein [Stenotrophomonas terrae]
MTATTDSVDARPFPRSYAADGINFKLHQPQLLSWQDETLRGRMVMSVDTGSHPGTDGKPQPSADYGTLDFSAHTQVDKQARATVLSKIEISNANFPTATDRQSAYLAAARKQLLATPTLTVSLDQLEAALAIAGASAPAPSLAVRNDPPEIIFSTVPAVLILIDGKPVLKASGETDVQRVINTRSLLLQRAGRYYLALGGHWASAATLSGPWSPQASVDAALVQAGKAAVDSRQVDAMAEPPTALKSMLDAGQWPDVHVRSGAAELIAVQGEPQFAAIAGTQLSYVTNTGADVFVDAAAGHRWYVLVSGRWFSAPSSRGPWLYVPSRQLPAGFARIPPDHPKSGVLASIAGTPEAREALIANSIPQTASVQRGSVNLDVVYDGVPSFAPVEGTRLQYARNTATPVLRVDADHFYAVDKGIWFSASAATGPWTVATSVPAVIYSIPTRSPLHYVTYVRIYSHDNDEVHVGYTPGYYGTVVADNVVVYGTAYPCRPWVGNYWYGCPLTYGMGVYFGWNPWVGWTFGWGWGWFDGWYGPYSPWWGPWYGPATAWGWWGGGAAAWNVYGHWGNAAVRGTAAAWADPWTGNVGRGARGGFYNEASGGRGAGRAGIKTNAYTGTTTAAAQGIRYNPQTGRVVAGGGAAAVNPYTDRAAAGGARTVVNERSGRVTQAAGGVVAGPHGAVAGGAFDSQTQAGGEARGAGAFHYNADTGTLQHGGVVDVNDNLYAGHDGHVYHYDDGSWSQVTRPDTSKNLGGQTRQSLDRDRAARERGDERISARQPTQVNMPRGAGGNARPVGGFRPALGGGRLHGGGFRH